MIATAPVLTALPSSVPPARRLELPAFARHEYVVGVLVAGS